jgi:transcriptional regulator with XRE-family HTH domain
VYLVTASFAQDTAWTADEIRQLRHRLGWSQAEMARHLNLGLATVAAWESGLEPPLEEQCGRLRRIFHLAETNAERIQRRPIADAMMRTRGLSQIHDLEVANGVIESQEQAEKLKSLLKSPTEN